MLVFLLVFINDVVVLVVMFLLFWVNVMVLFVLVGVVLDIVNCFRCSWLLVFVDD